MENIRSLKIILPLLAIFFISTPLKAYSPVTTHHGLTSEIIKFFEYSYPTMQFSKEEKEWIKNGSVDEDHNIRPMNHFYDPINNQGLWGFKSSKDWVNNTLAQANRSKEYISGTGNFAQSLFSSPTDFSWDRAIYEYVYGDKRRSMEALGHVLHLLEDATVPDHTRNDPHPPYYDEVFGQASPYEGWTTQFEELNLTVFRDLVGMGLKPVLYSDLNTYFDKVASFSNNNFFSKDSINRYSRPIVNKYKAYTMSSGEISVFGYNDNGFLLRKKSNLNKNTGKIETEYSITDDDNLIMSDYWNILSKEAVKNGAGVVKLFFDEVEKEKQSKALYNKNLSWVDKKIQDIKNSFANVFQQNQNAAAPILAFDSPSTDIQTFELPEILPDVLEQTLQEPLIEENETSDMESSSIPQIATPEQIVNIINTPVIPVINGLNTGLFGTNVPYAGFGGGGGGAPRQEENIEDENVENVEEEIVVVPSFSIINPDNFDNYFNTTKITFSGTSTPESIIKTDLGNEAEVSSAGDWSLDIDLEEGDNSIVFWAEKGGQKSFEQQIVIKIDSITPDLAFNISECGQSIVARECFLSGVSSIYLSWNSLEANVYSVDINGNKYDTSATSTSYDIESGNEYVFKISVTDDASNITTKEILVRRFDEPVVINEVAWMGNDNNYGHEWIELYNRTDKDISLDDFKVVKTSDGYEIALSGKINANSYYLLERGTDEAVSDISADLVYEEVSGTALNNKGDQLVLKKDNFVVDKTPSKSSSGCPTKWCAGSGGNNFTPAYTMERIDTEVSGEVVSNWGTAIGEFIQNGLGASGEIIRGTPRSENSVKHLITTTGNLNTEKTLIIKNSPYLITKSGFVVEGGGVLNIEKGVVIKFVVPNEPSLTIKGEMNTFGTIDDPVVITAYNDDQYGGNFDNLSCDEVSGSNCPQAGSWKQINISNTGKINFKNTIIRYGGKYFTNTQMKSMIAVDGGEANFENVFIIDSLDAGLYVRNSDLLFNGGEVKNTKGLGGIVFSGSGNANVSGTLFDNNLIDIRSEGEGAFNCTNCTGIINTVPIDLIKPEE